MWGKVNFLPSDFNDVGLRNFLLMKSVCPASVHGDLLYCLIRAGSPYVWVDVWYEFKKFVCARCGAGADFNLLTTSRSCQMLAS